MLSSALAAFGALSAFGVAATSAAFAAFPAAFTSCSGAPFTTVVSAAVFLVAVFLVVFVMTVVRGGLDFPAAMSSRYAKALIRRELRWSYTGRMWRRRKERDGGADDGPGHRAVVAAAFGLLTARGATLSPFARRTESILTLRLPPRPMHRLGWASVTVASATARRLTTT